MEIGIDIEENSRFEKMNENHLKEIFTENELNYAKKYINFAEHLCSYWCVKEAFVKATKNQTIEFLKIEVLHNDDGSPYIFVNEKIKEIIFSLDCNNIKISISHSKQYSTAVCLIY